MNENNTATNVTTNAIGDNVGEASNQHQYEAAKRGVR